MRSAECSSPLLLLGEGLGVRAGVMNKEKVADTHIPKRKRLSAKNRAAIKLLDEWMSKPDDMGEEWWSEYMKQLDESRLAIHREQ